MLGVGLVWLLIIFLDALLKTHKVAQTTLPENRRPRHRHSIAEAQKSPHSTDLAAALPAARPEKIHPPRKVPSSAP
jgi:hypothetical protein